jgi:hypothetical protein
MQNAQNKTLLFRTGFSLMALSFGIYLLAVIYISNILLVLALVCAAGFILFVRRVDQDRFFAQVAERSRNPFMLLFIFLAPLVMIIQSLLSLLFSAWPLLVNISISELDLARAILILIAVGLMIAGTIYNIRGLRSG